MAETGTLYPYIPAVGRGLKIIELLATRGALSRKQIASALDYNQISVDKYLNTFIKMGYIEQRTNQTYDLSLKLIDISSKFALRCEIKDIARRHLQKMHQKYNETILLGMLDKTDLTQIDKLDSGELLRVVPPTGTRLTAHHTALGKSILANLPIVELNQYVRNVSFKPITLRTLTSKHALIKHLERIRRQGFALENEESCPGLRGIAVPIFDRLNYPRFAIGISGPLQRLTPLRLREMQYDLNQTSFDLSKLYKTSFGFDPFKKNSNPMIQLLPSPEGRQPVSRLKKFLIMLLGS